MDCGSIPGVLPALLGVPADALRDARVPLEALLPDPARRATAMLADASDTRSGAGGARRRTARRAA